MTMTENGIVETIKKLLALAESNYVAEAATAAAKAAQLLHDHNLSIEELVLGSDHLEEYERKRIDYGGRTFWRRDLLQSIARACNARSTYVPGTTRGSIVGRPHETEITIWTYGYLARELTRLAKAGYQNRAETRISTSTWYYSFYAAAVQEVSSRLSDQRRHRGDSKSQGLVLNRDALVEAAVERFIPRLKTPNVELGKLDYAAVSAGREAGRTVPLSPPIEDRDSQPHLQLKEAK